MEYIFPRMAIVLYAGVGSIVLGFFLLLGLIWGKKGPLNYILGCVVCVVVGLFIVSISRGGTMNIHDNQVVLKVPLFKQKIIESSQVKQAMVVELQRRSPYYPVLKKSGGAVKNFRNGWFKLQNDEKAFLLLEGRKAIYVKTNAGDAYMFGMNDFDKLVQAYQREIGEFTSTEIME